MVNITIRDIIDRYDKVERELDKYNRDKNSELIQSLKEVDIKTLTDKQIDNVVKFLKRVSDDELTAYLLYILDNLVIGNNGSSEADPKIIKLMQNFKTVLKNIRGIVDDKNK